MKLLLTSGGVTNERIHSALVALLNKPLSGASALVIPTASYAFPGGAHSAWKIISGRAASPLVELGWGRVGVLELTALSSIDRDHWVAEVEQADALLVGGGDPLYLAYWMRESGLADLLPTLDDTVYVGVSAGSLVMGPCVGGDVTGLSPLNGRDATLGIVDFAIFPHLDHPEMPEFSMERAVEWAEGLTSPGYAIDDATAIAVVDGVVTVISEGQWRATTAPVAER